MRDQKFLKGDIVEILPEFQDKGDSDYQWIVLEDEEKGRVSISATNSSLRITPIHVVQTDWICHKKRSMEFEPGTEPTKASVKR